MHRREELRISRKLTELLQMVYQQFRRPSGTHFDWTPVIEGFLPVTTEFLLVGRIL
jgi:hypothetical protein